MDKIPAWLEGTKVSFVCTNCPNRSTKNIAFVQLETAPKAALVEDDSVELEEEPEELEDA